MPGTGDPRQDSRVTSGATQVIAGDAFSVQSKPAVVGFERCAVQPPSLYYVTEDDIISVQSEAAVNLQALQLSARILKPDGKIIPQRWTFPANGSIVAQPTTFGLLEGYLLSVTLEPVAIVPSNNPIFARISLQRAAIAPFSDFAILCQGYVSQVNPLFYPGMAYRSSLDWRGSIRTISQAPAAGTDISITAPVRARWRLMAMRALLTTSAAVANRSVQLRLNDGSLVFFETTPAPNQAASLAWLYTFASFGYAPINVANDVSVHIDTSIELIPQGVVSTLTANLQAADVWTLVELDVLQWSDGV